MVHEKMMSIIFNVYFCLFIQMAKSWETEVNYIWKEKNYLCQLQHFRQPLSSLHTAYSTGNLQNLQKIALIDVRIMTIYLSSPGLS